MYSLHNIFLLPYYEPVRLALQKRIDIRNPLWVEVPPTGTYGTSRTLAYGVLVGNTGIESPCIIYFLTLNSAASFLQVMVS